MKKNKKYVVIALLLLVMVAFVGGTVAYLTATSSVDNTFTVGSFAVPTTDPVTGQTKAINNYVDEPSWIDGDVHKLLPGASFDKDPYIGIGAGSEDAAVYAYVENNFTNPGKVYFTINSGWTAVSGTTTAGIPANSYTSGLFKYTAGLSDADDDNEDKWTSTPLFSSIDVTNDATAADFEVAQNEVPTITVHSFLHQAFDPATNQAVDATTIETAAKTAFHLNG